MNDIKALGRNPRFGDWFENRPFSKGLPRIGETPNLTMIGIQYHECVAILSLLASYYMFDCNNNVIVVIIRLIVLFTV